MARGRVENLQTADGKPVAGAEPGNTRAAKHLAHSEPAVRRVATVQKRRLLRQIGLRQADLGGVGLAYLDNWARAQAKVELMDSWAEEHDGWLDGEGNLRPFASFYFTALNTARRALDQFAGHLTAQGKADASMVVELQARRLR
ncbi:MAG: hypothetical protein ACRDMH_02480 [Solirubrobacterales bacterium]